MKRSNWLAIQVECPACAEEMSVPVGIDVEGPEEVGPHDVMYGVTLTPSLNDIWCHLLNEHGIDVIPSDNKKATK